MLVHDNLFDPFSQNKLHSQAKAVVIQFLYFLDSQEFKLKKRFIPIQNHSLSLDSRMFK